MAKKLKCIVLLSALVAAAVFIHYWVNTQPIWIARTGAKLSDAPKKNQDIVAFVEANGKQLAPTYEQAVCTEFVIQVINRFNTIAADEKKAVRIITNDDLYTLVTEEASLIRGVQTALLLHNKGIEIVRPEDVKPGDFVQFWNTYYGKAYGHCGVVLNMNQATLSVYSSHPFTKGYGAQTFLWPDKAFFVRLK